MTNKEAIKELCDWLEQMIQHGVPSHSAKRKALANAIALLSMDTHEIHTETHECVKETHDSDLISRAEALNKLAKHANGFVMFNSNGTGVFDILKSLPSVSAERVGEWIRKEEELNDCDGHRAYYWQECSECGARPPKDQWKNEWHSPYCPNCGARMENKK